MFWLKIVLLVLLGVAAINNIAHAGGYISKPVSHWADALAAVMDVLLILGVLYWL